MSISIITISPREFVVNNTHVTVYRDMDGSVRANPLLEPNELSQLKNHISNF